MAEHQLPAYLQARNVQDFTDYATDGIGGALPPHVSIQGNVFTLIDAAGQEFEPLREMDCVIVDRSNVACKMYYGKPYEPGSDEPPTCWSTNGIGPSKEAATPQARTCAECEKNVRGSAVSKMSGASIKACRDEFHMAILLPTIPDILFRYVLTPGSFRNWQAYTAKFKNGNVKISMVVTRMTFVPKVNGEIDFASVAYVDEQTNGLVVKALQEKATDVLVGRLDSPRVAAIAGPTFNVPQVNGPGDVASHVSPVSIPPMQQTAPQVQQTAPQVQQHAPFAQSVAPTAAVQAQPNPAANAGSPSDTTNSPAPRKRRRTAAEMAAANNGGAATALANGAGVAPAPAGVGGAAPRAPFPNPGQTAPATNNFGMAEGQPAAGNPELAGMLDDFFK